VLVTRPEPGLSETLAQLTVRGWHGLAAPAIRVRRAGQAQTVPHHQALVLTSGQALVFLPAAIDRATPVLAVGDATARRAREAGFSIVNSAGGDSRDLETLVSRSCDPNGLPLLFLTGVGLGLDVAVRLRALGYAVNRRVVYCVEPQRRMATSVAHALSSDRVAAVLFFSANTARAFLSALSDQHRNALRHVRAICISAQTAAVLAPGEWQQITIAPRPDADGMLDALGPAA